MVILALLVALSTVQTPAEAPAAVPPAETAPPPVLREIVLDGVSYFNRDQVLKAIRLQPGGRFRRDPEEVAASLRAHYEGQCFFAVRVAARFDPDAGRLTLTVDEGRMHAARPRRPRGGRGSAHPRGARHRAGHAAARQGSA